MYVNEVCMIDVCQSYSKRNKAIVDIMSSPPVLDHGQSL